MASCPGLLLHNTSAAHWLYSVPLNTLPNTEREPWWQARAVLNHSTSILKSFVFHFTWCALCISCFQKSRQFPELFRTFSSGPPSEISVWVSSCENKAGNSPEDSWQASGRAAQDANLCLNVLEMFMLSQHVWLSCCLVHTWMTFPEIRSENSCGDTVLPE